MAPINPISLVYSCKKKFFLIKIFTVRVPTVVLTHEPESIGPITRIAKDSGLKAGLSTLGLFI